MEEIEKLLKDMTDDIKQSKTDLECAFGDDTYERAVNSRINVLMQYTRRVMSIHDSYNNMACENCAEKGKCAIYDNFNIEYCSDYKKGDK